MKYKKLKDVNLSKLSKEEIEQFKDDVLISEKEDILKYINYLRWQQYNQADIKYMQKIINFLSYDEINDIEIQNEEILTGDVEDLIINAPAEVEQQIGNLVEIISSNGTKKYQVKCILEDSFEFVMIVEDDEGIFHKFGFIEQENNMYAYELFEETQEYYKQIIEAEIGTRVNVFADIVGENQATKTFTKENILNFNKPFLLTKKTNKGILSQINQGSYTIIKKETLLSNDGTSEDKIQGELSKFKNEIAEKLNINVEDIDKEFDDVVEEDFDIEQKYTKEDFEDDFKFTIPYYFSIETPEQDFYNSLTHTILNLHTENWEYLNDDFIDEVYNMLYIRFNTVEIMEGIWAIENTKLESILRTIVRAGGKIKAIDKNASVFLQRFLKQEKLKNILKISKNFRVVKKIKTKKDVEQFVKDSGTELYLQMNQTLTAILEGTCRLYGDGYIVFDSDYKLIICEVDDEIDLIATSNFAIDNGYKNFYVIEKDKYIHYDAWYKETINTIKND